MSVTREQAEQVLEAVKKQYRPYWEPDGDYVPQLPVLIENWEYLDHPTPWAIVWEEGPDEWAYRASSGGVDEEMCYLMSDVVGVDAVKEMVKAGKMTESPVSSPSGVYVSPVTGWALGIYED